jgi:DNA invertase Pin-like site-specific DNA recombinase
MVQPTSLTVDQDLNTSIDNGRLATWLKASIVDLAPARRLRLAWMGRTSDDEVQDPTISLPRQLRACRAVLTDDMAIDLHFWDVETSRKELDARGSSTAWRNFDIAIPRDGGIGDLLAEAQRPDRRFDGVICESIDRIARLTYQSTKIEHDLEQLGVPLIAADEPIMRSSRTGRIEKKAGMVLLRRAKQGVAEWYVLEMLEKSRNGIEIHTDQGFNVGKPPYGYVAEKIKHPVPAKRAAGKHKTRLVPHPVQGGVIALIFDLRVNAAMSYRAIASRLNEDLVAHPPPEPTDPDRALGRWSPAPSGTCSPTRSTPATWSGTGERRRTSAIRVNTTRAKNGSCPASPNTRRWFPSRRFSRPRQTVSGRAPGRMTPRPSIPTGRRRRPIGCGPTSIASSAATACTGSEIGMARSACTANRATDACPKATRARCGFGRTGRCKR